MTHKRSLVNAVFYIDKTGYQWKYLPKNCPLHGTVWSFYRRACVIIPPKLSVSKFMWYLKGKRGLMIFDKHPEYKQKSNRDRYA